MKPRRPEVADVFREHEDDFLERYGGSLSSQQRQVYKAIVACRTAALGGHQWRCEKCGHEEISYNSCRNRHCPKCQGSARATWMEREAKYLLDVEYFHVVFTLPAPLRRLALSNQRALYGALFRAAAETLLTIARDPKHLGAEIGFVMVLHTWGQNLEFHPHVHCVVPGGGLSSDASHWISCREGFFLPVRVLSRLYRGKFLAILERLYRSGELKLEGVLETLRNPREWKAFLRSLRQPEWVVYSKPPFGGPKQVLKYLARYTHRVAISNQRLVKVADGKVSFRWKDYAHGQKKRRMTLSATEFIRRFLLHVLPKGFVRIRHYGFLSNRTREEKLKLARKLLGISPETQTTPPSDAPYSHDQPDEQSTPGECCPCCKQGRLVVVAEIPKTSRRSLREFDDSS